jgi:small-conductance mechanosensitive channel
LNTPYPYSVAFGVADTREACIKSTEKVYFRLLSNDTSGCGYLHFDTLALLAVNADGTLDDKKLTELVRLFRPDREGNLTLMDFAKSIDAVYKEIRLLRANVKNASRLDHAFEDIFHIFFFFVIGCICLAIVGVDPLALFASVSGFILGFSFMIGSACSKIVEGVLLILVRRPYDIGDRIGKSES